MQASTSSSGDNQHYAKRNPYQLQSKMPDTVSHYQDIDVRNKQMSIDGIDLNYMHAIG